MTEQALHLTVAQYLDLALPDDAVWTTIGHGVRLPIGLAKKLKRIGVKAGMPDIAIFWRGAFFIELKTPKGDRSKAQREMHPRLKQAGAQVATCRSVPEVQGTLKGWGIPVRAAA